jgi:hypothetical protein
VITMAQKGKTNSRRLLKITPPEHLDPRAPRQIYGRAGTQKKSPSCLGDCFKGLVYPPENLAEFAAHQA